MSEDVLPVKADFDPSEVEEIMKAPTQTEDQVVEGALDALVEAVEGSQTGGKRPEKKRGEPQAEYEKRVAEYEAEREARRLAQQARDEELGDGATTGTTLASAPTPTGPEPKRARTDEGVLPLTREAARGLATKIDSLSGEAASAADRAGAWLFTNLPGFVQAAALGTATKAAIDNPYSVAWLGKTLVSIASSFVARFQSTADWSQYADAISILADSVGDLAINVRDATTAGPGFAIAVTLLIMRHRANQQGGAGSVMGQIAADARAVANAATRIVATGAGAGASPTAGEALQTGASYLWSAMVNAASAVVAKARSKSANAMEWALKQREQAQGAANVAALGEIAQRARAKTPGKGAQEMSAEARGKGAPSAGPGPTPGTIALTPATTTPAPASAFDRLTLAKIPTAEQRTAAELSIRVPILGKRTRIEEARGTPVGRRGSAPAAAAMQVDEPEEEATGAGAGAEEAKKDEDVEMEKKGGRRKTRSKRKTYRKKGKKTRGKTRNRRAFIY
jgi:hypothetical protein